MRLDFTCPRLRAEPSVLLLEEKLADGRLAVAVRSGEEREMSGDARLSHSSTAKNSRGDLGTVREGDLVLKDVGKRAVPVGTLERSRGKLQREERASGRTDKADRQHRSTHDHLVDEDTERPPVDGRGVTGALDNFGCDVLCKCRG